MKVDMKKIIKELRRQILMAVGVIFVFHTIVFILTDSFGFDSVMRSIVVVSIGILINMYSFITDEKKH